MCLLGCGQPPTTSGWRETLEPAGRRRLIVFASEGNILGLGFAVMIKD